MPTSFAPGARVEIRDAEWVIRKAEMTPNGQALHVTGLSDPVKDRSAIFLSDLEDIRILRPEDTELVPDQSPAFRSSLLFLESLLRRTPPTDERIHIGHRGAMNPAPYQLHPTARALGQTRQRILIADAVGLGKTLEAGILVSELIRRGRGRRILVVTVKSMMTQFQKEFWSRFTIPLVRLDSAGIQRVYSRLPAGMNPFHHYDRTIISVDTLKQDVQYRTFLEKAWWDIIIIDEAHNVAERGGGISQRARLARLLSERSDTLILLSATPHDGKARSFASIMNMLDPTAIADPSDYGPEDIKGLFVRRFKKDIQNQAAGAFRDRKILTLDCRASREEEEAFSCLAGLELSLKADRSTGDLLFRIVLEKALFSSPAACLQTLRKRLQKLRKEGEPETAADIGALAALEEKVAAVTPDSLGRYRTLLATLRNHPELAWNGSDPGDRLVIFSERLETLHWLKRNLLDDLGLHENAVAVLHGGMSDTEQQRLVEDFGKESAPVRLLLASDVASEGINLHYLCHRLVHFDIPWSLMTFQQRNGRIDRYGQTKTPLIAYLVTRSENGRIRGDLRILELLIRKDEEAVRNIGDPSVFLGLYSEEEEERWTAGMMQSGKSAEEAEKEMLGEENWFEEFMKLAQSEETREEAVDDPPVAESPSLYRDDLEYLEAALNHLASRSQIQREINRDKGTLEFVAPEELKRRFRRLPREIWPENGLFRLTLSPEEMEREILRSRVSEESWPSVHYLWPLHPAVEWVNDKVLTSFSRHEAPVMHLPEILPRGETVYLLSGLIPNRKGHPLIHRWFGVVFSGRKIVRVEELEDLLERTGLRKKTLSNPGAAGSSDELRKLLHDAVLAGTEWMLARREEFRKKISPRLAREKENLERLRGRHHEKLERSLEGTGRPEAIVQGRKKTETRRIDSLFDQYLKWVEDTLTTEPEPYIQILTVLKGAE